MDAQTEQQEFPLRLKLLVFWMFLHKVSKEQKVWTFAHEKWLTESAGASSVSKKSEQGDDSKTFNNMGGRKQSLNWC